MDSGGGAQTRVLPALTAGPVPLGAGVSAHPVRSADDIAQLHALDDACCRHDYRFLPADPLPELTARLTGPTNVGDLFAVLLRRDSDGAALGFATLELPRYDNLDSAVAVLDVHPEHRGRGVGPPAARWLLAAAAGLGRTRVTAEVCDAAPPGQPGYGAAGGPAARLARALGFGPALVDARRVVHLDGLAELPVPALPDGYALHQWRDRAADRDLDDLALLHARMSTDPPLGELGSEPEVWDAARVRAEEDTVLAGGRLRFSTAVRDERSGRLVAFTDIAVSRDQPTAAFQWGTLVLPEYRRRGLALPLKRANLAWVRTAMPAVGYVVTWNALSNTAMIAVNERCGYTLVDTWTTWERRG